MARVRTFGGRTLSEIIPLPLSSISSALSELEAMELDSGNRLEILRTDGGMVENDLLMQFQADILGREVIRPMVRETTALGAAYAAGLAVGFYKDLDELREHWETEHTWEPYMEEATRNRLYSEWKKAVSRSFHWAE